MHYKSFSGLTFITNAQIRIPESQGCTEDVQELFLKYNIKIVKSIKDQTSSRNGQTEKELCQENDIQLMRDCKQEQTLMFIDRSYFGNP